MPTLMRILGALALIAIALFCGFGFLASFEPGNGWQWKAGYGALGCICLFVALALLRLGTKLFKTHVIETSPGRPDGKTRGAS